MTLTQVKYILAVDRCRNFAQAARECFVTQPTLSMQIQKLEDYLQIIIFDRNKTPVEPTPMGKKVLELAQRVMVGANELEELSKTLRGEISGEYILAVIPTLAPYLLPLFVQKFVEQYPRVDLKIYELQTSEIIEQLKNGKIDGAILATPLDIKELDEEFLFHEPFKVFLSKDHSLLNKKNLDENDLSVDEAWLLKEGHCLRTQTLQLCRFPRHKDNRHPFFEAGSLETLINMVKSLKGFTVLPYLACLNLSDEDSKNLRPFKQNVPVRNIGFVTGPLSMKKSIDKVVIKAIQDHLPRELKKSPAKAQVMGIN